MTVVVDRNSPARIGRNLSQADRRPVASQHVRFTSRRTVKIPKPHRCVCTSGEGPATVSAHANRLHGSGMASQRMVTSQRCRIAQCLFEFRRYGFPLLHEVRHRPFRKQQAAGRLICQPAHAFRDHVSRHFSARCRLNLFPSLGDPLVGFFERVQFFFCLAQFAESRFAGLCRLVAFSFTLPRKFFRRLQFKPGPRVFPLLQAKSQLGLPVVGRFHYKHER